MTLRPARLLICHLSLVHAWPLPFSKREDSRLSVPASIYTPTVVIFVVFLGLAALGCLGRALLRRSRATQLANANRTANPTGTPANQLTGTITADDAWSAGNTPAHPTRPRRHRRPRRTPSQVSVTSLPEYMKEPGEHELVIGQSPARTHTLTMPILHHQPTATAVVDDDEDAQTQSGSSRYYPIPTSANTIPLLHEQGQEQDPEQSPEPSRDRNSNDISLQDLSHQRQPTGGSTSIDTTRSESANTTHTQSQSPTPISTLPVGPAPLPPPAYFEVVADDDVPLSAQTYYPPHPSSSRYSILSSSTSTFSTSNAPLLGYNPSGSTSMLPEATRTGTTRARNHHQSGFRTFLNRVSMSMPSGSAPNNNAGHHQRSESSNSNTSTTSFFRRPGSSLSSISLAMNPNQTYQSRASLLSSPSTVSINSLSISAPLTHTASRTQFTFPQSKSATITPEQVKVIAAREAIGKFGVPYGPDAVAFAASAVGVGPPPPGFEEIMVGGSGSRLDSGNDDDVVEEEEVRGEGSSGGRHSSRREISASASSMATVRVGHSTESETIMPGPSGTGNGIMVVQGTTSSQSQSRDSILDPKPSNPSSSSHHTNGIDTLLSPPTPTQDSTSEFGALSSSKLLSPDDNNNNVLRSGSISSNYSSQTYVTAPESLPASVSVPLTTSSSNSTSRSSSYSVVVGLDVVNGWSSSSEEEDEGRELGMGMGMGDEVGSVTPRIARVGLVVSEVE